MKHISLLASLLLVHLIAIQSASACSCTPPEETTKAYQSASVVFFGKVVSRQVNPLRPEEFEVEFEVFEDYKGNTQELPKLLIYTPLTSAGCGITFRVQSRYIVYASGNPAHYRTLLCSRTKDADTASSELDELRALAKQHNVEDPSAAVAP